jgi:hypothetical protein
MSSTEISHQRKYAPEFEIGDDGAHRRLDQKPMPKRLRSLLFALIQVGLSLTLASSFFSVCANGNFRQSKGDSKSSQSATPPTVKAAAPGFDDEPNVFAWEQRRIVQPHVLTTDSITGTTISKSLSILFKSAEVSLQRAEDPLTKTMVAQSRFLSVCRRGRRSWVSRKLCAVA